MMPCVRDRKLKNSGSSGPEKPELIHLFEQDIGIEDTKHRFLAERRRHRRHAELDFAACLFALDAAVLRPPFLREIAARQQLDARDDRLIDHARNQVHFVKHPVDAQAHQRGVALGLEVDVRCALLESVAQDMIQRRDDRRGGGIELFGLARKKFLVAEIDRRASWR